MNPKPVDKTLPDKTPPDPMASEMPTIELRGHTYEDHREMARRRHLLRLWLKVPDWPAIPEGQAMHTSEDHPLWLRQRTAFMEVPSRYLAEITERQAELAH